LLLLQLLSLRMTVQGWLSERVIVEFSYPASESGCHVRDCAERPAHANRIDSITFRIT
jgi:hypothetical protein